MATFKGKQTSTWVALAGAAVIVTVVIFKLINDLSFWRKGKPVRHTREWLITAPFHAAGVYLLTSSSALPFIQASILSTILAMGFVWFTFDLLYQLFRKQPAFGTGSNDPDDAKSDDLLQSLPKWAQITLKVFFLVGPIITYVLTFK